MSKMLQRVNLQKTTTLNCRLLMEKKPWFMDATICSNIKRYIFIKVLARCFRISTFPWVDLIRTDRNVLISSDW